MYSGMVWSKKSITLFQCKPLPEQKQGMLAFCQVQLLSHLDYIFGTLNPFISFFFLLNDFTIEEISEIILRQIHKQWIWLYNTYWSVRFWIFRTTPLNVSFLKQLKSSIISHSLVSSTIQAWLPLCLPVQPGLRRRIFFKQLLSSTLIIWAYSRLSCLRAVCDTHFNYSHSWVSMLLFSKILRDELVTVVW